MNIVTLKITDTVKLIGQNLFNINGSKVPDIYFVETTEKGNRCIHYRPNEIKERGENYITKRNELYFNTPISKILFVTQKLASEQYGNY